MAVTSLVTGITSFTCIPGILALVAIVTGIVGLQNAKRGAGRRGFAIAGIVLGAVNIVLSVIAAIVFTIGMQQATNALDQSAESLNQADVAFVGIDVSSAALDYYIKNDTFTGATVDVLQQQYGLELDPGVSVQFFPLQGGMNYCYQFTMASQPGGVWHDTYNNDTNTPQPGPCPVTS